MTITLAIVEKKSDSTVSIVSPSVLGMPFPIARIKEATGVDVAPIYYAAGYKDGTDEQRPYNLSKLMVHILRHTKQEKRAVFIQDINKDEKVWRDDDRREDYKAEIKKSTWDSVVASAISGAKIGAKIGSTFGPVGVKVGTLVGGLIGGLFEALR